MKIQNLFIDVAKTVGRHKLLIGIEPVYEYVDNNPSDKVVGYRYEVALPSLKYDTIKIKIMGPLQIDWSEDMIEQGQLCDFNDLDIYLYTASNGRTYVCAKAESISLLSD